MKILLTGEVQVGKSTIIRKVTERHPDWKIGGFVTVKAPKGAQIPQNWPEGQEFLPDAVYICRAGKPLFSSEFGVVGDCGEFGFPKGFPEVFDRVGKRLAEDTSGCHLILMDELGFMENEAELFQEAVIETLKSGVPVLGVVKKKSSPFSRPRKGSCRSADHRGDGRNRDSLAAAVEREISGAVEDFRRESF